MPRRALVVLALLAGCGSRPRPATRFASAPDVDAVVADRTGVYALAGGGRLTRRDGSILRVDRDGTTTPLAYQLDNPRHLASGAGHVWWLAADGVYRISTAPASLPEYFLDVERPTALTVVGGDAIVGVDGAIVRITPGAREPDVLVADAGDAVDLATDGASIYWADKSGGRVMRADLRTRRVIVVAKDQAAPVAVAVEDGMLAWVTDGDVATERRAIVAVVPTRGGRVRVLRERGYGYADVALAGGWVYWTWGDLFSSAHRMRLDGKKLQTLADDRTDLDGLAILGTDLWIGGTDGVYHTSTQP